MEQVKGDFQSGTEMTQNKAMRDRAKERWEVEKDDILRVFQFLPQV
jgi:hypothetical protein